MVIFVNLFVFMVLNFFHFSSVREKIIPLQFHDFLLQLFYVVDRLVSLVQLQLQVLFVSGSGAKIDFPVVQEGLERFEFFACESEVGMSDFFFCIGFNFEDFLFGFAFAEIGGSHDQIVFLVFHGRQIYYLIYQSPQLQLFKFIHANIIQSYNMLSNPFAGKISYTHNTYEPNRYFPSRNSFTKPYGLLKQDSAPSSNFTYAKSPFHEWGEKKGSPTSFAKENPFDKSSISSQFIHRNEHYYCPVFYSSMKQSKMSSLRFEQSKVVRFDEKNDKRFEQKISQIKPITIDKQIKSQGDYQMLGRPIMKKKTSIINQYGITMAEASQIKSKQSSRINGMAQSQTMAIFEMDSFGRKQQQNGHKEDYNSVQVLRSILKSEHEQGYYDLAQTPKLNGEIMTDRQTKYDEREYPDQLMVAGRKYYRLL